MKKIITLLVTLLLCTGICFATDNMIIPPENGIPVHREYKRQLIKVLEYEEWAYNNWIEIPKGWHVVNITANNHVVIIVLEAD